MSEHEKLEPKTLDDLFNSVDKGRVITLISDNGMYKVSGFYRGFDSRKGNITLAMFDYDGFSGLRKFKDPENRGGPRKKYAIEMFGFLDLPEPTGDSSLEAGDLVLLHSANDRGKAAGYVRRTGVDEIVLCMPDPQNSFEKSPQWANALVGKLSPFHSYRTYNMNSFEILEKNPVMMPYKP